MNAIVEHKPSRNEQKKVMLLEYMADKYSLTPDQFRATVRATCGLANATPEQVAAFLIVAKEYDLNPLLKEIYAFPAKGGGVVPIVSIDGWVNLVNSHPQCDGFNFTVENDEEGKLFAITCTMHRKDRKHPTVVTEYLSECARNTEPWKMKHRMLRHKSFIQAARYAFGFAGIYDEDEGRTIAEAVDVTPKAPMKVPSPDEAEQEVLPPEPGHGSDKYKSGDEVKLAGPPPAPKEDPITTGPQRTWMLPPIDADYDVWMAAVLKFIGECQDGGELETFFTAEIDARRGTDDIFPSDMDDLVDAYTKRQQALNAEE